MQLNFIDLVTSGIVQFRNMAKSEIVGDYYFSLVSFSPPGEKNPVIFLHAMLCSNEIWTTIPTAVAEGTRRMVYTFNARNHGNNPYGEDFNLNVDDLFKIMDAIKADEEGSPEKFIVVGHDLGGMTAIKAALKKPERFEKVIIMEMYAKRVPNYMIDRTKDFVTGWTKCVQELPKDTPKEDVTRLSVENLYKNLKFQEDAEKKSYLKGNFLYKHTEEGYDAQYNTGGLVKSLDKLKTEPEEYQGTYDGPAYFFYGTESHYKIADEEKCMKEHFPNSELVPIAGGSHFFVADMQEQLSEKLINCINKSSRKV